MMLTERNYDSDALNFLSLTEMTLFAVNVKGVTDQQYRDNTRKEPDWPMFLRNLQGVVSYGINFYLTFTGVTRHDVMDFKSRLTEDFNHETVDWIMRDHYVIDLINYDALPHVDSIPWGEKNASTNSN